MTNYTNDVSVPAIKALIKDIYNQLSVTPASDRSRCQLWKICSVFYLDSDLQLYSVCLTLYSYSDDD